MSLWFLNVLFANLIFLLLPSCGEWNKTWNFVFDGQVGCFRRNGFFPHELALKIETEIKHLLTHVAGTTKQCSYALELHDQENKKTVLRWLLFQNACAASLRQQSLTRVSSTDSSPTSVESQKPCSCNVVTSPAFALKQITLWPWSIQDV